MFEELTKTDSRWKFFVWPNVSDPEGAQEAITLGYWCSFSVAVATTIAVALGVLGVKVVNLFDAAVFAVLGIGIWRKWRSAAVVAFLLFAANFMVTVVRSPGFTFPIVGIFLFFGFLGAVRGTFANRRLLGTQRVKETDHQETGHPR